MELDRLDHLVLTVEDVDRCVAFDVDVLGMSAVTFGGGRRALTFGAAKINLHQAGQEFEPKALRPTAGSADLCFIVTGGIGEVVNHLEQMGVVPVEGPVERAGAQGIMDSVYVRDPDGNLGELSVHRAG